MISLLRRLLTGEFDYASVPHLRLVPATHAGPPVLPELFPPVEATAADWRRANALFDHRRPCRCSTCALAAGLSAIIRKQEGR
jgi:hypothetical protein